MRKLVFVAVAFAVCAIPASAGIGGVAASADHYPPNLDATLDEIKYAIDHEEDAYDALDEGGSAADDYAAGQIDDALFHIARARDFLSAAVRAGEISGVEASGIDRLLAEVRRHDRDALFTIDGAGSVGDTLDDLEDALDDKEDAGDWIYYGDDGLTFVDLGCVINVFPFAGDVGVGFDGCDVPVVKFQLVFGYDIARFSNGFVGSGNQLVFQFACAALLWWLNCVPPRPLMPPSEYIYAYFGPLPSMLVENEALAYASDGRVQRVEFFLGGPQATDLHVMTLLRDLTPYGLRPVPRSGATARLGQGHEYVFQTKIENMRDGAARDVNLEIDLPPGFTPIRIHPKACTRSAAKVRCPLGTFGGGYAGVVNVWGTPGATGSLAFRSAVRSGATEPSPDPSANTATTAVKVYGIPRTTITRVDGPVAKGRRGSLSGRATPGAAFEAALERVTKVEIAVLRDTARAAAATPKPCLWLNKAGGFTKVPRHRGNCDKGVWLQAKGTGSWKYVLKKGLPKGRYTLLARGTNAAGITGRTFGAKLKNAVTFSVK